MEYDPSSNLNSSFHVGVGILNLLLMYELFYVFPYLINIKI